MAAQSLSNFTISGLYFFEMPLISFEIADSGILRRRLIWAEKRWEYLGNKAY